MAEAAQDMSDDSVQQSAHGAGYGLPPRATRFQKGRSGNPRGRPRGRNSEIPYDNLLGQMVTIREDGRERRVTAAEAFLLQLTQKGLAGDSAAARASLTAIEAARGKRPEENLPEVVRIRIFSMGIGCLMRNLGLAVKTNRLNKERVLWWLRPWIVEAAIKRLGDRKLTPAEQQEVWNATRKPETVNWPEWWTERS